MYMYRPVCFIRVDVNICYMFKTSFSGATPVHYLNGNHLHIDCSTGISGATNNKLIMNITFYGVNNTDRACSAICNYELHTLCDWNNLIWTESNGTCSVTIDAPTIADTGYYCCKVSSKDTYSQGCDYVLVRDESDITPAHIPTKTPQSRAQEVRNIIIGSIIGAVFLILVLIITAVYLWRRRHRVDYEQSIYRQKIWWELNWQIAFKELLYFTWYMIWRNDPKSAKAPN